MLKPAYLYKTELENLFLGKGFDEKNKYYFDGRICPPAITSDTLESISYVSVCEEQIIGFLSCGVNRWNHSVSSIGLINFTKLRHVFSRDLVAFWKEIFEKFKFQYVVFACSSHNPALHNYRKLVKRLGGREIGYIQDDWVSFDNTLSDTIQFQITKENYDIWRNKC